MNTKKKNSIADFEDQHNQYMSGTVGWFINALQKLFYGLLFIAVGAPILFGLGGAKIPEYVVIISMVCLASSVLCTSVKFALNMYILKRLRPKNDPFNSDE